MKTAFLLLLSIALSPLWSKDFPAICDINKTISEVYSGGFDVPQSPDRPQDIFSFSPTEDQWAKMIPWVRTRGHFSKSDYIPEAYDCDDFAREFVHLSHRWAVENFTKGDPYPIAVYTASVVIFDGFMGVKFKEPSYHHALNIVRMSSGVWFFYDPMLNLRVPVAQALYGEGNVLIKKVIW